MTHISPTASAASVFRIDQFVVPAQALPQFSQAVQRIHHTLASQPGCRQSLVLTRSADPGQVRLLTLVEWASASDMAAAKAVVQRQYSEEGFDPPAFMRELGVQADLGVYSPA
ncbi:MAG: antibiotic biosynthesis monooxygenase [Rhizobacter sp.]|nr:antibiotic biosynthesis monooxygenase [Rhizobacter sp.]